METIYIIQYYNLGDNEILKIENGFFKSDPEAMDFLIARGYKWQHEDIYENEKAGLEAMIVELYEQD